MCSVVIEEIKAIYIKGCSVSMGFCEGVKQWISNPQVTGSSPVGVTNEINKLDVLKNNKKEPGF